jgi:hypothetical protein
MSRRRQVAVGIGVGLGIRVGVGIGLGVGLGLACSNPAKGEASSLVANVDRFRRAENAEKPSLLPAIEGSPCTDQEVCAAKDACLAHAKPTAEGLVLKTEVQRGLSDLEDKRLAPDAAAAAALPEKLYEASRLLDRGHAALAGCDQRILALRAKFGL